MFPAAHFDLLPTGDGGGRREGEEEEGEVGSREGRGGMELTAEETGNGGEEGEEEVEEEREERREKWMCLY